MGFPLGRDSPRVQTNFSCPCPGEPDSAAAPALGLEAASRQSLNLRLESRRHRIVRDVRPPRLPGDCNSIGGSFVYYRPPPRAVNRLAVALVPFQVFLPAPSSRVLEANAVALPRNFWISGPPRLLAVRGRRLEPFQGAFGLRRGLGIQ